MQCGGHAESAAEVTTAPRAVNIWRELQAWCAPATQAPPLAQLLWMEESLAFGQPSL